LQEAPFLEDGDIDVFEIGACLLYRGMAHFAQADPQS
jgi:hypothetical protein